MGSATPYPGEGNRRNVSQATTVTKRVYAFEEGAADMKAVLGGKGANLAEMSRIGLPVPHGFTVTAQECIRYQDLGKIDDSLAADIDAAMKALEQKAGRAFGDRKDPLLVCVRSGAGLPVRLGISRQAQHGPRGNV